MYGTKLKIGGFLGVRGGRPYVRTVEDASGSEGGADRVVLGSKGHGLERGNLGSAHGRRRPVGAL